MEDESIARPLVEIYSKPGCSLCVATRAAAEAVRRRIPFDLVERDVREDEVLRQRWRYQIPVVCIDGAVAFLRGATEEGLERRLTGRAPAPGSAPCPAPAPGGTEPG